MISTLVILILFLIFIVIPNNFYAEHLRKCNNDQWTLALDEQIVEVINLLCSAKDYDPMDISPDVIEFSESLKLVRGFLFLFPAPPSLSYLFCL